MCTTYAATLAAIYIVGHKLKVLCNGHACSANITISWAHEIIAPIQIHNAGVEVTFKSTILADHNPASVNSIPYQAQAHTIDA